MQDRVELAMSASCRKAEDFCAPWNKLASNSVLDHVKIVIMRIMSLELLTQSREETFIRRPGRNSEIPIKSLVVLALRW